MSNPVIDELGNKRWYDEHEDYHRGNDLPAVEFVDGEKQWWRHGELHRIGGPAVEYVFGDKYWYKHGKLHRLDGPAIENGSGYKEWRIEGIPYTEEEFNEKIAVHKEDVNPKENNFNKVEVYDILLEYVDYKGNFLSTHDNRTALIIKEDGFVELVDIKLVKFINVS